MLSYMTRLVHFVVAAILILHYEVNAWVKPARSLGLYHSSKLQPSLRLRRSAVSAREKCRSRQIRFPSGIESSQEGYNIFNLKVAPSSSVHDPRGLELTRPYDPDLYPGAGGAESDGNMLRMFGHTWKTLMWRFWRAWRSDSWSAWVAFGTAGLLFDGAMRSWSYLRSRGRTVDTWGKRGKPSSPPPLSPAAQVLECDVCESQLRPARGRGAVVVGSPSFRCPHCGVDGSHFFDIDDITRDDRARRRIERLKYNELEDLIDL